MKARPSDRPRRFLFVLAAVGTLSPFLADGQEWIQQRYTTRNGLAQNSVLSLAMDSIGFLWITTEGGLVRCDGDRFKRLPLSTTGELGPERMRQLIPTLEKDLFVNDSRGEVYSIHGHVVVIPAHLGSARGLSITGGFPGRRLFSMALDRTHPLPGRDRWPGLALNVIPRNMHDWFVQCDGTLLAYRDSSLLDSIGLPERCSRLFLVGRDIFGFDGTGAFRVDAVGRRLVRVVVTDDKGAPVGLDEGAGTVFWSADTQRAYLCDTRQLYVLTADRTPDHLVVEQQQLELPQACTITSVVASDTCHMIAVGTDTKGLFVYHPKYMRTIVGSTEGSAGNSFYAQAALPDGGVITVSNNDQVVRFDRTGRRVDPPPVPVSSFEGLFHARNGEIWYSPMPGLERYDPATGERGAVIDPPATTTFHRFLDEGDSIWLADEKAIQCWTAGRLTTVYDYFGNEAFRHAQFICRRDPGRLWFGTCDGLYSLTTATGQVDTVEAFRGRCVRIMEHINERVFVGTYGSGAFVQDGGVFRPLPSDPQGFLSHVHAFLPDGGNGLWMSTNQGVFRMGLRDIDKVLADTNFRPHMDYFGEWAGIENSEFNGGCDPPCVRLSDGTASFPTMGGLVWFRPEEVPDMRPGAPVMIEEVVVDGRTWPVDEQMVFGPGTRSIEVFFAVPYWGDPANVHLEYWLKGRPGGWAALDHGKRSLRFRDLPPGEYELLLRKTGSTDMASAGQVWFNIRKRFYQHTWARAGFGVLGLLMVWGMLRLNEVRLRRINRRLEQRVSERTRELEEANRGLRASMELKQRLVSIISHDIVTPLRFIERVARSGARSDTTHDAVELSETLRDIAFSAEKLYANARNTLSWIKSQEGGMELRPMHVALNPLVEEICDVSRALAQHKGLRLLNEVSLDDVILIDRDVLSIILHNLITNAITHTEHGEVRVSGGPANGDYSIMVADAGHGMSAQALAYIRTLQTKGPVDAPSAEHEGVQGLGYVIIVELVRLLGARMEIDSAPDKGTRVTITLTIKK